jgi:hypothetical protein
MPPPRHIADIASAGISKKGILRDSFFICTVMLQFRRENTLFHQSFSIEQNYRRFISSFFNFFTAFFSFIVLAGSFLIAFLLSCALLISISER